MALCDGRCEASPIWDGSSILTVDTAYEKQKKGLGTTFNKHGNFLQPPLILSPLDTLQKPANFEIENSRLQLLATIGVAQRPPTAVEYLHSDTFAAVKIKCNLLSPLAARNGRLEETIKTEYGSH
jgi:hypothetical protein